MIEIYIVEDDAALRASLVYETRRAGYTPCAFASAEEALAVLEGAERTSHALLLADIRLEGLSGVQLVSRLKHSHILPPTVVISGEASISETVEVLRLGVFDVLEKPFSSERLLRALQNAIEHARLEGRVAALEAQLDESPHLIGSSSGMIRLRELIERAAATDSRVLIRGETGSGKELVAAALHDQGGRRGRPLVRINCAAIPPNLIEDELFGHVRGAFTDARSDKPGLFELADGGTLFLDEIGDMDVALQARLLRVLEDGAVRRVGDTRERPVDVRVITATHRDLGAAVSPEEFRQDLYFRLAQLVIEVPPLRERGDDIVALFEHFLAEACRRNRLRPRNVDGSVLELIRTYRWPGNVRELKNVCEHLAVFGGEPITLDHVPGPLLITGSTIETGLLRLREGLPVVTLRELKAQVEREYIEHVLRRHAWSFTAAAEALGMQRTYLHQKAAALGISRPSHTDPPG